MLLPCYLHAQPTPHIAFGFLVSSRGLAEVMWEPLRRLKVFRLIMRSVTVLLLLHVTTWSQQRVAWVLQEGRDAAETSLAIMVAEVAMKKRILDIVTMLKALQLQSEGKHVLLVWLLETS